MTQTSKFRHFVIVAVIFSLVAFLGGLLKLGGAASIALDSWASFFVAAFFGPVVGGVVAASGHFLSALSGGFPFTPLVHLAVMGLQFVWAFLFGWIFHAATKEGAGATINTSAQRRSRNIKGLVIGGTVAIFGNGVVSPFVIGLLFPHLAGAMQSLMTVLVIASAVNVALAIAVLQMVTFMRARRTT